MSRNRNFCFTHNNYPDTLLEDELACKYIGYAKEIAPTTGTPHLQGWVSFENAKTLSAVRRLLPGCHIVVMRGTFEENDDYCSKSATMTHRGIKPQGRNTNGVKEIERWEVARNLAKEGKFDEIDADICLRCYSTLKNIYKDYQVKPAPVDVKCFWIHGLTGTGKSHCVETAFPDCYKKSMDDLKWFDGYNDEDVVYLEDFDIYQVKWGGMLKRLADKWPMQASIKGAMKYIRPRMVIVTSNYPPDRIWTDSATLGPLERRFKVVEKMNQEQVIDFNE